MIRAVVCVVLCIVSPTLTVDDDTHWKLTKQYSVLLSKYSVVSSKYSSLSSFHEWQFMSLKCSDFMRTYIPSMECGVMEHSSYSDKFVDENPTFARKMGAYHTSKNKGAVLSKALHEVGFKLINRNTCEFRYLTEDEIYQPTDTSTEDDKGRSPTKCEKFAYFFYAVSTSEVKYAELIVWKDVLEEFKGQLGLPFPLVVQDVLYATYWANQVHHDTNVGCGSLLSKSDETTTIGERRGNEVMLLHTCLLEYMQYHSISTTPRWTSPTYQAIKHLGTSPYITTTAETTTSYRSTPTNLRQLLRKRLSSFKPYQLRQE